MLPTLVKIVVFASFLFLSACAPSQVSEDAHYWQRSHASEAAYMQGPKVQQMLNRDIARCVTELRELERLGVIKDAIPNDTFGDSLDPDKKALEKIDHVQREGYLLAEHRPYRDFESCMHAKGWDRTKYVPYDVVDRAEDHYYADQHDKGMRKKASHSNQTRPANNFNE